jgi:hypothetical protein
MTRNPRKSQEFFPDAHGKRENRRADEKKSLDALAPLGDVEAEVTRHDDVPLHPGLLSRRDPVDDLRTRAGVENVDEERRSPGTGRIVNALSCEKDQKEQEEKSHFPPIVSCERS